MSAVLKMSLAELGARFPLALRPVRDADEMYRVALEQERGDAAAAKLRYMRVGAALAEAFLEALRIAGKDPADVRRLLDFAGGWGRAMRFLRPALPDADCALSDIDQAAVDFAAAELGVEGLYSALDPADLAWRDRRFDAILVVSLFTHLKPPVFNAWLAALIDMTAPGGVLVATTHPLCKAGGALPAARRSWWRRGVAAVRRPPGWPRFEPVVPGHVYFSRISEAEGRLDLDYYGGSLIGVDWMRGAIAQAGGRLRCIVPRLISDHDVYVIDRPG